MSVSADRRKYVRFEVVGVLRGSLEVQEAARVVDISDGGALLETATPIAAGTIRPMALMVDGQPVRMTLCARRLAKTLRGSYAVGVEFMGPSEHATDSIRALIADARREIEGPANAYTV